MTEITSAEFEKEVLEGGKVVLDFYSTECPPCEALAPKFESLARLYGNDIKFLKIFRQKNRELADHLGVKSSPTLLFFDGGKATGEVLTGGVKRKDIITNLNKLISSDKGLSYCATCDAKYYGNKEVVVIGGGNSAVEESDFTSKFAKKITLVHQFDTLTANKTAQEKLYGNPKISTMLEHEPRSFKREGDKIITEVEDLQTKEMKTLISDGVFIFIGMKPNVQLFKDKLILDQWGYIKTDEDMRTSMTDIFAVGDVISKKYRQITTAVADGTIAAIAIAKELN